MVKLSQRRVQRLTRTQRRLQKSKQIISQRQIQQKPRQLTETEVNQIVQQKKQELSREQTNLINKKIIESDQKAIFHQNKMQQTSGTTSEFHDKRANFYAKLSEGYRRSLSKATGEFHTQDLISSANEFAEGKIRTEELKKIQLEKIEKAGLTPVFKYGGRVLVGVEEEKVQTVRTTEIPRTVITKEGTFKEDSSGKRILISPRSIPTTYKIIPKKIEKPKPVDIGFLGGVQAGYEGLNVLDVYFTGKTPTTKSGEQITKDFLTDVTIFSKRFSKSIITPPSPKQIIDFPKTIVEGSPFIKRAVEYRTEAKETRIKQEKQRESIGKEIEIRETARKELEDFNFEERRKKLDEDILAFNKLAGRTDLTEAKSKELLKQSEGLETRSRVLNKIFKEYEEIIKISKIVLKEKEITERVETKKPLKLPELNVLEKKFAGDIIKFESPELEKSISSVYAKQQAFMLDKKGRITYGNIGLSSARIGKKVLLYTGGGFVVGKSGVLVKIASKTKFFSPLFETIGIGLIVKDTVSKARATEMEFTKEGVPKNFGAVVSSIESAGQVAGFIGGAISGTKAFTETQKITKITTKPFKKIKISETKEGRIFKTIEGKTIGAKTTQRIISKVIIETKAGKKFVLKQTGEIKGLYGKTGKGQLKPELVLEFIGKKPIGFPRKIFTGGKLLEGGKVIKGRLFIRGSTSKYITKQDILLNRKILKHTVINLEDKSGVIHKIKMTTIFKRLGQPKKLKFIPKKAFTSKEEEFFLKQISEEKLKIKDIPEGASKTYQNIFLKTPQQRITGDIQDFQTIGKTKGMSIQKLISILNKTSKKGVIITDKSGNKQILHLLKPPKIRTSIPSEVQKIKLKEGKLFYTLQDSKKIDITMIEVSPKFRGQNIRTELMKKLVLKTKVLGKLAPSTKTTPVSPITQTSLKAIENQVLNQMNKQALSSALFISGATKTQTQLRQKQIAKTTQKQIQQLSLLTKTRVKQISITKQISDTRQIQRQVQRQITKQIAIPKTEIIFKTPITPTTTTTTFVSPPPSFVFGFGSNFLVKKVTKKVKKKRDKIFALTPDFTSRILGLKPQSIYVRDLEKFIKRTRTGFAIRRRIKIT